jgi:PAS domain-containing protein
MQAICSYCERDLGTREPLDDPSLTHGMCQDCFDHFANQWDGQRLGEYLDRFEAPVAAVDSDGRIIAINAAMAAMMGVASREAAGLLGGEFMECVHARLPDRCGGTVHCTACTVRSAVEHTMATGEAIARQPAHVNQPDGRLDMFISTTRSGDHVQLVIDGVAEPSRASG